jgi:predicted ester cyclase
MSIEENKAIARRLIEEGWTTGNLDIWDEIYADSVVEGSETYSLEAYKEISAGFLGAFPERSYTIHNMVAEGDKVVVQITLCSTHTGKWAGVLPTNKQLEHSGAVIFRFAGGKIAEDQWIGNMLSFWQQLGVIPLWEELVEQANAKQA